MDDIELSAIDDFYIKDNRIFFFERLGKTLSVY